MDLFLYYNIIDGLDSRICDLKQFYVPIKTNAGSVRQTKKPDSQHLHKTRAGTSPSANYLQYIA